MGYCTKCGKQYKEGTKFCTACGSAVKPAIGRQSVPPAGTGGVSGMNPERSGVYRNVNEQRTSYGVQAIAEKSDHSKPKKKKHGGLITFLLIILIVGALGFTGFVKPGFLKKYLPGAEATPEYFIKGSTEKAVTKAGEKLVLGTLEKNGYTLSIGADSFVSDREVSMKVLSKEEAAQCENQTEFVMAGSPVELETASDDEMLFGDTVELKFKIPEDFAKANPEVGRYIFWVYDEDSKTYTYYDPDYVDMTKLEMGVALPHFCTNGVGALTPEAQANYFLEKYCMDRAISESDEKLAAEKLEPYFKKKVEALELTKKASKELVTSLVNYAGSKFGEKVAGEGNTNFIGIGVDYATTVYNAIDEKNKDALPEKLNDISASLLVELMKKSIEEGTFEKTKYGAEMATSSISGTGRMLGYLQAGDWKAAAEEAGSLMQGMNPKVAVATNFTKTMGALVNQSMMNWKSNEVEQIYQKYINGSDRLGIEAKSDEDIKMYLRGYYHAMGFSKGEMVMRFYRSDCRQEMMASIGLEHVDFDSLSSERKSEIYEKLYDQAETLLLDYFKKKSSLESRAAELKKEEFYTMKELLSINSGALREANYAHIFGEDRPGYSYSVEDRFNRILKMRKFISDFVDSSKMEKNDPDINYGYLINQWCRILTYAKTKDEQVRELINLLASHDILKPEYRTELIGMDDLAGIWELDYVINVDNSELQSSIENTLSEMFGADMSDVVNTHTEAQKVTYVLEISKTDSSNGKIKFYEKTTPDDSSTCPVELDGQKLRVEMGSGTGFFAGKEDYIEQLFSEFVFEKTASGVSCAGSGQMDNYYMNGSFSYKGRKIS